MRTRAMQRTAVIAGALALSAPAYAQAAGQVGGRVPATKVAPGPAIAATASVKGAAYGGHQATDLPSSAHVPDTTPYKSPKVAWPAGGAQVQLAPATAARAGGARQAGSLPLSLAGADTAASAATSEEVFFASRTATSAAGVNGVVFTLARADGGSAPSPTRVSLDYAAFSGAYGGGYADRLKLVRLPACALTTPKVARCRVQTPVVFSNDLKSGTLTATVPVGAGAAAQGSMVLAATSSASGAVGTYTATSLSPAGSWSAGGNDGAFTYAYPITVPAASGASAPSVSLAYDSASVDGRTSATNAQASWIGDGWDYSPGYIERSYQACSQDGVTNSADLCWGGNIVTFALNGHSGALVRDDASGAWKLQNDDGATVVALTGQGNGAWLGEAWEIIEPDGTQYYFGANPDSLSAAPAAASTWTEPVYCPKLGDGPPNTTCYSSFAGTNSFETNMAWRWNLDYVIDPHGNLQTYTWTPETNYYDRGYFQNNESGTNTLYTRGGYLSTITYGTRVSDAVAGAAALDTVTFNVAERCTAMVTGFDTANCTYAYLTGHLTDTKGTTPNWPDVPADEICPTQSATCTNYGPSFFTTKQLSSITTSVLVGGASKPVDTYTLTQMFPSPQAGVVSSPYSTNKGDGTVAVLWLSSILHAGVDTLGGGSAASTPQITFLADMMPNRVDGATTGAAALYRPRMDTITTETGAKITVSYYASGYPQNCSRVNHVMPSSPDSDSMYCYAQYWTATDASSPTQDWFTIYPVQAVTVTDAVAPAGWSEAQVTSYAYTGAAWHRDDSPLTPDAQRTWDQFRGFRTVTTTHGAGGAVDVPTQTVATYLQGMNGDYLSNGTQRSVAVSDTVGDAIIDSAWLRGQALESDTLLGAGGAVQSKAVSGPWTYTATATEKQLDSMPAVTAEMLQAGTARSYKLWHDGTWKSTQTDTAYDGSGRVITSDAKGDGTAAVPEVCTTTSYAASTSSNPNMLDYPDEVKAVEGTCAAAATAADTVSDTLTYYDNSTTLGALTGAGDATETQAVDSYNAAGAPQYITESTTAYDAYGRVTSMSDAKSYPTTTAYSTPGASPDTVTVTNAMGWSTSTTLDPARGLTIASSDANGELSSRAYDGLGRLSAVWSPLHAQASGAPADETFTYNVSNTTAPTTVTSEKLLDDNMYNPSVTFYDAVLRPIQIQAPTVDYEAGRLITDTHYNSLGQVTKATSAYYEATSQPTTTMFVPTGDGTNAPPSSQTSVPQETETLYDGLGRTIQSIEVAQGTNQWSTLTGYKGADETDKTPPAGGTATSTFTDALGRTTATWAYTTAAPTGKAADAQATTYTYTPAGKNATMADAAANTWTWTYDLHGRQIKAVDPGTGTSTTGYDPDGNITTTTDADGNQLTYSYDQLGRKNAEYNTTGGAAPTAANQIAAWSYDTLKKGHPTSSTSYTNGSGDATHAYTEAVSGYTALYQPTGQSVTIPAAEGKLAGTYQDTLQYTAATSLLDNQTYNAEGSLPAEGINFGYDLAGTLAGFGGTQIYLNTADYNPYGQVELTNYGAYGTQVDQTSTYDPDTGRRLSTEESIQSSSGATVTTPLDQINYTYNQAGQITSESNLQTGNTTPDTQCFTYDHLDRLTAAYTDTGTITTTTGSSTAQIFGIGGCADTSATAGKIGGGPAPYAETFGYDALGDRVRAAQLDTSTATPATTQTLAYNGYNPATGASSPASNPDAIQAVTTTTATGSSSVAYGYDQAGNTDSRITTTTGPILASEVSSAGHPLCIENQNNLNTAGNPIWLNTCTGNAAQNWTIHPDGTIQINGGCLDTAGEASTAGTKLVYEPCNAGAATQHWVPLADGAVFNTGAERCLDDPGGSTQPQTPLQIWDCNGQAPQRFTPSATPGDQIAGHTQTLSYNAQGRTSTTTSRGGVDTTGLQVAGEHLAANTTLGSGQWMMSRTTTLVMQADGNLVLYDFAGTALWSTGTGGNPGATLSMQGDGNLVVHTKTGTALWTSNTAGKNGAGASVQDDGNLVIYLNGAPVWASNTSGKTIPTAALLPTDTATGYTYDADGNLLIQHDPAQNQTTLYLPYGEEIYLNTDTGKLTGNRYITASPDGTTIVHASSGAITYEMTDAHDTATTTINATTLAATNRSYDPYGNPRGTTPTSWPDQHSYLGKPQDPTTNLDLLGARQYDPTTARFLAIDPILETGDQNQMNGYAYAADNPVNNSDPTGQMEEPTGGGACGVPGEPPCPSSNNGGGDGGSNPGGCYGPGGEYLCSIPKPDSSGKSSTGKDPITVGISAGNNPMLRFMINLWDQGRASNPDNPSEGMVNQLDGVNTIRDGYQNDNTQEMEDGITQFGLTFSPLVGLDGGGLALDGISTDSGGLDPVFMTGSGLAAPASDSIAIPTAFADVRKFSDYIFKPGATHGKTAVFEGLGYGRDDSQALADEWMQQAGQKYASGDYTMGKLDQYGQRINITIELRGVGAASGKVSYMVSGWMIQPDDSITLNTPFSGFAR